MTTSVATLAYKGLLARHQDEMTKYMIEAFDVEPAYAECAIDQLWDRWTGKLMEEYPARVTSLDLAERAMNEALGFIDLMAHDLHGWGPKGLVDDGWHIAILYSREYHALCYALTGGRPGYIHHEPNDVVGWVADTEGHCAQSMGPCSFRSVRETMGAMRLRGPVDDELWQ